MTHQKKHPGYTVNSITFYNPPYNSQQTTAVNQQHLQQAPLSFPSPQYVSYAPLISSPSSSTAETSIAANLSHQVHSTMQAHPPSTVNLQQLSPQFFHLYPQLVIPSFTPISADVKVAKVISSSSDAPSSTNVKVAKVQKIQRLERNRLAARECRERRKAYIINLENRTSKLEDDNLILRYQIQELTTKLELMEYINQDNIRLENEVRELKKRIMGQANKCARVLWYYCRY
ncbi:20280_t:CDS:2 [Rhizophagus irregularis]|nr:20280_t:CDS:2 [Rhizophagus irregularis]